MEYVELTGIIVDIDYIHETESSAIRITLRANDKIHILVDLGFFPYFYLVPSNDQTSKEELLGLTTISENGEEIRASSVSESVMLENGVQKRTFKIETSSPRHISKLSGLMKEFGICYEYDILFWKRYLIDKGISPLIAVNVLAYKDESRLVISEIKNTDKGQGSLPSHICFDIETYNPAGMSRPSTDPSIMISYTDGSESAVLTTKEIALPFVRVLKSEGGMIEEFVRIIAERDYDIIVGYNSSNFDLPYLQGRAKVLNADFSINRVDGAPRSEHHGLVEAFKIPGRANLDIYNVARFVSVVGAAEQLIKVNSFKLMDIYKAITGKDKITLNKGNIWEMWDNGGDDLAMLARYSMSDAISLNELYDFFIPLEMEIAKVSGTTLAEAAISTTGQLVEFMLMRYAHENGHLIPNKPSENDISARLANPFEGAYVKTPEAGIYEEIAIFDFRGLYPSIIIAHNIDMSTLCSDCEDAYVSPDGTRFRKDRQGIFPTVLKRLIKERNAVKEMFKKDKDNKSLTARYQALKILANSFYGYMGYARSRWYSRECAAGVTSFGRKFITDTIDRASENGFKVIYGDTDSLFILMNGRTRDDVLLFVDEINASLPDGMELELEGFYTRGVFVGKKGGAAGAKKKYAMISESGKIKIKGFELVRRDWSNLAKETQKAVLEAILREGSKDKAAAIVKETIRRLRAGEVDLKDLVIHTQLNKSLKSYDIKSPEVSAAKKAIAQGVKTRAEMEGTVIGYIITNSKGSISEKAEVEETAKDYDIDYYVNHQVLPATMKLLKELGYSEDDLKSSGEQRKL
jgi:DNA polymerase I